MGLEGIVSKRKDSPYRSGRSGDWLKCKNPACEAAKREAEEDWGRRKRKAAVMTEPRSLRQRMQDEGQPFVGPEAQMIKLLRQWREEHEAGAARLRPRSGRPRPLTRQAHLRQCDLLNS
jgi:ATP-dependent DNA ligase